MANNYKPGECHTHQMTEEEQEECRKEQEKRHKKYPWRYHNKAAIADYLDYKKEQQFACISRKRRPYKPKGRRKDK